MSSTHVGKSDCQLMMWMGITKNLHRMQCNLMDRALAWPVFFTSIAPEPLNLPVGLLDLCNLLQNPCVTFISFLQENYKAQNSHWEQWDSASARRRAMCGRGDGLLSSTESLWFTGFSFHLLSTIEEFYRCLASSTPFISPPVDIQIHSQNKQ